MISLLLIGGVVAVLVAAIITWELISEWLMVAKSKGTWAKIIKDRLENGDFVVVAGVFDEADNLIEETSWRAKELDEDIRKKFAGHNLHTIRF
jgi:hypothetical protein